jgi:hypothetical protein
MVLPWIHTDHGKEQRFQNDSSRDGILQKLWQERETHVAKGEGELSPHIIH